VLFRSGIVSGPVDTPVFVIAAKDDEGQWWILLRTDIVDGKPWEDTTVSHALLGGNEALLAIQTQPYYIRHRTPEEVAALEAGGRKAGKDGWLAIGNTAKRSRSLMYVPLRSGGEMIGYVSAQSYRFNAFSIRNAEDLILIGEYIGLAVQSAWRREQDKVRRAEESDPSAVRKTLNAARTLLARAGRIEGVLRQKAAGAPAPLRADLETLAGEISELRRLVMDDEKR
jgi:GAF domain-containing protein